MKIALVFGFAPPEPGACAVRAMSFARHFQQAGHEVRVFAARRAGVSEGVFDGVPVVRTPRQQPLALVRAFQRWTPDVVLASTGPSVCAFGGVLAARWLRRPVMLDVRDLELYFLCAYGAVRRGSLKYFALKFFESFSLRCAQRVSSVTESVSEALVRTYRVPPQKILLAPNGVDAERFQRNEERGAKVRQQLNVPASSPLLVFAGTPGPFELPQLLTACAPRLTKRFNAHFLFLIAAAKGTWAERYVDELRDTAEQLGVSRFCRFVDGVPNAQVADYLSAADVALNPNPSAYPHAMPVKTHEYLCCELPLACKSTAGSELERFMSQRDVGFCARTWAEFADQLEQAVAHLDEFRAKGKQGPQVCYRRSETNRLVLSALEAVNGFR
ncbi:MAG: glycosyltransferase family 4 protein [Abditibacteriales bacterium]|nr:glycosyltransferase family 4 protein [Abditibacteriales bacterium]